MPILSASSMSFILRLASTTRDSPGFAMLNALLGTFGEQCGFRDDAALKQHKDLLPRRWGRAEPEVDRRGSTAKGRQTTALRS
jgi:hypothetical protein